MRYIPGLLIPLACVLFLAACAEDRSVPILGLIRPSLNHLPVQILLSDRTDYPVTVAWFQSGWELNEALVSGHVDIAIMPFTFALSGSAHGKPVKTVSFFERESDGIVAGPGITRLRDIRSLGVLKASTLEAFPGISDSLMHDSLTVVPFRTPTELAMALTTGKVEAICYYVPPILKLPSRYRVIHWFGAEYPAHPCCNLVINTERMKGREDWIGQFITDLDAAIEAIPEKGIGIAIQFWGLDRALAGESLRHTVYKTGTEASGRLVEEHVFRWMKAKGYIPMDADFTQVYIDEADR